MGHLARIDVDGLTREEADFAESMWAVVIVRDGLITRVEEFDPPDASLRKAASIAPA